jgi:hypothetical protein
MLKSVHASAHEGVSYDKGTSTENGQKRSFGFKTDDEAVQARQDNLRRIRAEQTAPGEYDCSVCDAT